MENKLTPQESEEYFYNSLCNAVGTGYMDSYGIEMEYGAIAYATAKQNLAERKENSCYEDILMEILRIGGELTFKDLEGDMTTSITMKDVHDKVQLTPLEHLMNMVNENDDVETADVILQTVFFGEIIFG